MKYASRLGAWMLVLILVMGASILSWRSHGYPVSGIDDSDIFLHYAENIVNGHGMVWNPGGERVEGFTSAAFLFLLTGMYAISPQHVSLLEGILNILMLTATLWWILLLVVRLLGRGGWSWGIALLAVALVTPGFVEWNVLAHLDTGLWTFVLVFIGKEVTLIIIGDRRPRWPLLLAMGFIPWVRPESMLYGPAFLALILAAWSSGENGWRGAVRPWIQLVGVFFGSLAVLVTFRMIYFGYPLPNTYYAKVSSDLVANLTAGAKYIGLYLIQNRIHFVAMLAMLLSMWILGRKRWKKLPFSVHDKVQGFLAALSMVNFGIILYTGGDFFPLSRFMHSLEPFYLLTLFHVPFWVANLAPGLQFNWSQLPLGKWLIPFIVPVVVYAGLTYRPLFLFGSNPGPFTDIFKATESLEVNGRRMNGFFDMTRKPMVGVTAAGAVAFAYDGPTLDLLGLNHTGMAHADKIKVGPRSHASFNKRVFYEIAPDMLEGEMVDDTTAFLALFQDTVTARHRYHFHEVILKGMYHDEDFLALYQAVLVTHPKGDKFFHAIMRKSFIAELEKAGYKVRIVPQYGRDL